MEDVWRVIVVGFWIALGVFLFTPFEAVLEGFLAILLLATVIVGFLLHPRKEIFHVKHRADG